MPNEDVKKNVAHRLKIVEGHLKKVMEMVEDNKYCIDILNQSLAVQNALKRIDEVILENHLKTCVADKIKQGKNGEAIKEVIEIFKRRGK